MFFLLPASSSTFVVECCWKCLCFVFCLFFVFLSYWFKYHVVVLIGIVEMIATYNCYSGYCLKGQVNFRKPAYSSQEDAGSVSLTIEVDSAITPARVGNSQ